MTLESSSGKTSRARTSGSSSSLGAKGHWSWHRRGCYFMGQPRWARAARSLSGVLDIHPAMPPPPERVKLPPLPLHGLECLKLRPQRFEDLVQRPDVVIVPVEAHIQGGPGVGVLHGTGARVLLVNG